MLRDALSAGVSRGRLRAGDLTVPSRGIRLPRDGSQALLDFVRPFTIMSVNAVASHTTAARLHGIPLPWRFERETLIHLTRPASDPACRRTGVIGHERVLPPADIVLLDGVPVTSLARTWLDLATLLSLDDLVVAADYLISEHHRHFGLPRPAKVPADDLIAFVAAKHRLRGLRLARAALDLMRVGVDSPPETRVRLLLFRAGLPEFTPDYPVEGKPGETPIFTDLGCAKFKVCGEYEGNHHLTPQKQAEDRHRDEVTRAVGPVDSSVGAGA
ncbi:hypothetical protein [Specibacter cremeus]|uniref:hypothetical protein n=1 Tax=Specibacter cremeus TaxID=1629051 RepID=UPI000F797412|nr:hypothetical protein [Specibacter cremeus]